MKCRISLCPADHGQDQEHTGLRTHWKAHDPQSRVGGQAQTGEMMDKYRNAEGGSAQFSHAVVSDSLRPHEPQHVRPPCPSPASGVYSNSRPTSR